MPETMSPELLLAATRGPQVETLGDAFARMRANQDAAKARKQQLTLGDISTEEGRMKLAQLKQDAQLDQERRQAMRDIAGGGKPPQQDDVPQPGSPQLAPQAPMQAPQGALSPGMVGVNQGMGAPPQQAAIPQPAPTPQSPFAADEAFIANRRAAGDFRAADAAEQALLKRKLDTSTADKNTSEAGKFKEDTAKSEEARHNASHAQGLDYLNGLPDEEARRKAFPFVVARWLADGSIHADHAQLDYDKYGGKAALERDLALTMTQADKIKAAEEKRKADLAPSQLAKSKTEADQAAKINAGTSAMGITAEQQAADKRAADALAETKKYHGQEIGLRQSEFALQKTKFDNDQKAAVSGGLAGVPPHLIAPASAGATKAGEEYASAIQVSNSMKTMLDLAAKGNKAAGSNLPLVGVETLNAINGIKRINGAEIAQYGSAGSMLDHIQGKIGKLAVGEPIPKGVLDDIRTLHTELDKGAQKKYADRLQNINSIYHSQFKPVEFSSEAPSNSGPVQMKAPDGTVQSVPADQVDHYLKMGAKRVQ